MVLILRTVWSKEYSQQPTQGLTRDREIIRAGALFLYFEDRSVAII